MHPGGAARPDRGARGAWAWLFGALAFATLLALTPRVAVAASLPGASVRGCAQAFDSPANAAGRARVSLNRVLVVQIFPTPIPSCVIRFQLSGERVLSAVSAWRRATASAWRLSIRAHGRVGAPTEDGRVGG
jgi:hypothetical protein